MGVGPAVLIVRKAVCLVMVAAAGGCGLFGSPAADPTPGPLPGTRLDVPDGDLAVTAWLPDGHIYLLWGADLASPHEILRVAPGRPAQQLTLPAGEGCQRTEYRLPHRLPDGRLGLAVSCETGDPTKDHIDLVAYHPASRRLEMLAPLGEYNPAAVSWRKDLASGYVSAGGGICDGFAPLTRHGITRFPGPVTLNGHTWRLDEVFFTPGSNDCRDLGRAGAAQLTPDERRLVFRAAPAAQGHSGQSRLDYPTGIYVQDLPDGTPRQLVTGFSDTRGLAMAPDGRQVAVAGRRGREQGLWLVNLDSGAMRELASARLSYPSFSPDGRQLSVTYARDENHSELRVLDIP